MFHGQGKEGVTVLDIYARAAPASWIPISTDSVLPVGFMDSVAAAQCAATYMTDQLAASHCATTMQAHQQPAIPDVTAAPFGACIVNGGCRATRCGL